jgi:glycine hydroxymethyltransferase
MATLTSAPAQTGLLLRYLQTLGVDAAANLNSAVAAFYAGIDHVHSVSPSVAAAIVHELRDQRTNLKLIASENYSSLATQLAHANLLTDKYAEGYPYHRFYAGCDNVDIIEAEACQLACELFGADHAYVQPHSGADANLVAFTAILSAKVRAPFVEKLGQTDLYKLTPEQWAELRASLNNQRLLALDYYSGGHLTHGYRNNVSAQLFDVHAYTVDPDTKLLNLDGLRQKLQQVRPLVLLAGYSAYSRKINFAKLREMADEVGAVFMVDMAHFAGLVAGKVFTGDFNPVVHAHIVTSTTHKTLRGPSGGIVLCKQELAEWVDKGCPAILGKPLAHALAAKAVAFREALKPEFQDYARRIVENSQALAANLQEQGLEVLTGGTDNHMLLVDVSQTFGLTGRQAEAALRACNLTLNRNSLPFDANGAWFTSGIRLGTPAATTLGMGTTEMAEIARIVKLVLDNTTPGTTKKGEPSRSAYIIEPSAAQEAQARVQALLVNYRVYPELNLEWLLQKVEQPATVG